MSRDRPAASLADTTNPFVLIDDAREAGAGTGRLYRDPVSVLTAHSPDELPALFAAMRAALSQRQYLAGHFAYEAGYALDHALAPLAGPLPDAQPLGWFGVFDRFEAIASDAIPALLPDPAGSWAGPPRPRTDQAGYETRVARVLDHIVAGDIYQANLSLRAEVPLLGHPLALYARLRAASLGAHQAVVWTGAHWLLSCSPELFFDLARGVITARPMKGTALRAPDPAADARAAARLAADPKQRAENLMIVDLMRNDVARVAQTGSVAVPGLFAVETYPTVHQLTSTVTARLDESRDAIDLIAATFPCGSVTGAPKIRAMEVIDALEDEPRGPYTGSIGTLDPDGDARFNVAIRTLSLAAVGLHETPKAATLGLGSGIVADSSPAEEWRECLAKGGFVTVSEPAFDLFETMGFDPVEGLIRLDRHIARMRASAELFGFAFNRHVARNTLQAATFRVRVRSRVRLMLSRGGAFAVEVRNLVDTGPGPVTVALVEHPVRADDFRLAHKTSDRDFYRVARAAGGQWEAVLVTRDGRVTEGSFTNIFVERGGQLHTPPLADGLLPGVLRAELIEDGRAREAPLTPADLADGFYVGNSARGLIPARLASAAVASVAGAPSPGYQRAG